MQLLPLRTSVQSFRKKKLDVGQSNICPPGCTSSVAETNQKLVAKATSLKGLEN